MRDYVAPILAHVVAARGDRGAVGRALGAHPVPDAATVSAVSRDPAAQLRRDHAVLRDGGVRRRRRRGWRDRSREWQPFADTRRALRRLAGAIGSAIVSNIDSDLLADSVGQLQAPFSCLVTAEDARAYKPDPKPLELAHHAAGGRPRRDPARGVRLEVRSGAGARARNAHLLRQSRRRHRRRAARSRGRVARRARRRARRLRPLASRLRCLAGRRIAHARFDC